MYEKFAHKIKTREELAALLGPRPRKRTAIMCHGTFDIVHPGHLRHLMYAKEKADVLIASVTADAHITKGAYRPYVPQELRAANLELATRIFGKPLQLMVMVAFAAGALIIALTSYAQVAERRREYGIVKAMGATGRRLTVLALGQSLALAVLGLATGLGLFLAGRALIGWLRPQFEVLLTPGGLAQAVGAALLMALLAATIPARRLVRLDPATAYRGA